MKVNYRTNTRGKTTFSKHAPLHMVVGIPLLVFGIWVALVWMNSSWFEVIEQFIDWIWHPHSQIDAPRFTGSGMAAALICEVTLIVWLIGRHPSFENWDVITRLLAGCCVGIGSVGTMTLLLGIFGILDRVTVNIALGLVILALVIFMRRKRRLPQRLSIDLFLTRQWTLLLVLPVFMLLFFLSAMSPISYYDSLIYHATMAADIFHHNGFSLIAGPSVGLPMSANYPPLFPSIGSLFFIQTGGVNDTWIRLLGPAFGFLTIIATYQLGLVIYRKRSLACIGIVLLLCTPVFTFQMLSTTYYPMLAFFLVCTALFMLQALTSHDVKTYSVLAGFAYSFALLTSYESLYFAPAILVTWIFWAKRGCWSSLLRMSIPVILVGSIWYWRNLIVLGNPLYPYFDWFFGGEYLDSSFLETAFDIIHDTGNAVSFGDWVDSNRPSPMGWVRFLLMNRHLMPAFGVLLVNALILTNWRTRAVRTPLLLLLGWIMIPTMILFFSPLVFPRHLVPMLPIAAVLSAGLFVPILEFNSKSRLLMVIVGTVVFLFAVFPGSLPLIMSKGYIEDYSKTPPPDAVWHWEHIGTKWENEMPRFAGDAVKSWVWLNDNLGQEQRVATLEWRTYYIKEGDPSSIFFLDGYDALPLYEMHSPAEANRYLRDQDVEYVCFAHSEPYKSRLEWIDSLGSEYFPLVMDNGPYSIYQLASPMDGPS